MPQKVRDPVTKGVPSRPKRQSGINANRDLSLSQPDVSEVPRDTLFPFTDNLDAELNYMKRLKYRVAIENSNRKDLLPPQSDFETKLQQVMKDLNTYFGTSDAKGQELIFARFGTRSIWNIANQICTAQLARQSTEEFERLITGGAAAYVDGIGKPTVERRTALAALRAADGPPRGP